MSSRTTSSSTVRGEQRGAVQAAGAANTFCSWRNLSGIADSVSAVTVVGSSPGQCLLISRTASSEALPHTPHEDVV